MAARSGNLQIDRCGNDFDIRKFNALVFHWDEVCKLTNKNISHMKQEKGRFSFHT